MDTNTMVTLSDGQNYLLTQKTTYNGSNYFMAVGCDEKGVLQKKYGIIKETVEDGKTFAEFVADEEDKKNLLVIFSKDFADEVERETVYLKVGQVVEINGRDYTLLDYIPMYDNLYGIFITLKNPLDIMVCKRSVNDNGEEQFVNVTTLDEGIMALQVHSAIHLENK